MLRVAKGEQGRWWPLLGWGRWAEPLPQSQPPPGWLGGGCPLPGCGQGDGSPCACPGRTHPLHLLMRTSGPGGLQGDTWGGQMGMKVETGREETVPSCMGTAESQGLLGFWGHFGRYLSPTPPLGPDPIQGGVPSQRMAGFGGRNGFPFPPAQGGAVTFGGALEGPVLRLGVVVRVRGVGRAVLG